MTDPLDDLAADFAALTVRAGVPVMAVYAGAEIETRLKDDRSPVSAADEASEAFLLAELARLCPQFPVVAEESAARGETPPHGAAFLLVDPLDGTREFIARARDFTINVALVEDGVPRAGAVYAPALGEVWFGASQAWAATVAPGAPLPPRAAWRRLRTRMTPDNRVALVSHSHRDPATRDFLARHGVADTLEAGSSLKFCRVAEGVADVYPRFGPTMEWDTAAGDAVLRAAGGVVVAPGGAPFRYGKTAQAYRNGPFVAWGDPRAATLC